MNRGKSPRSRRGIEKETTNHGLVKVMRHDAFIEGYTSLSKGLPFNRHASRTADEEWHYERGRQVVGLGKAHLGYVPSLWCGPAGATSINPKVIDLAGSMMMGLS